MTIHGPNQSGRQWAGLLLETMAGYDMEQFKTDPCEFSMLVDGKVELIMAVHVDDIMIAGSHETCGEFIASMYTY